MTGSENLNGEIGTGGAGWTGIRTGDGNHRGGRGNVVGGITIPKVIDLEAVLRVACGKEIHRLGNYGATAVQQGIIHIAAGPPAPRF